MNTFSPNCLPMLIGSLPGENHQDAMKSILAHTPEIPLWPQLPGFSEEGMIPQFLEGMPGVDDCDGTLFVDSLSEDFDVDFLSFYEDYIMHTEEEVSLENSRFALTTHTARGFFEFLDQIDDIAEKTIALKAQTTGPFTFATGLVDQDNRAIFYNDQLKDAAIKLLALKAKWQIQKMKEKNPTTIMIFDEPALAGFGSSAYITISAEDIQSCLGEVFSAVQSEGAIAGVHVCANTEWSILFDAGAKLISFDAYSYFDKFVLYPDHLRSFMENGGILASGIIPTTPDFIDKEDVESLTKMWHQQTETLVKLGIPRDTIIKQSLITPACGTGSVTQEYAEKVMWLTHQVSDQIRKEYNLS